MVTLLTYQSFWFIEPFKLVLFLKRQINEILVEDLDLVNLLKLHILVFHTSCSSEILVYLCDLVQAFAEGSLDFNLVVLEIVGRGSNVLDLLEDFLLFKQLCPYDILICQLRQKLEGLKNYFLVLAAQRFPYD